MGGREREVGGIGDANNFGLNGTRHTELGMYPRPCQDPEFSHPRETTKSNCSCCSKNNSNDDKMGGVVVEMTEAAEVTWKGKRKYEYFQGNNHFYCGGRIMTAPSIKYFSLSFAIILVTFGLFIVFDAPFLTQRLSIAIPIVSSILFVLVVSNMLRTSCSDPGIIPRASAAEVEQMERSYGNSAATYRPPPRTKDIVVNGQVIKSKYCFTCRMFRPPRASHCSVCDNCVERFDHHCPFLGNCVGRRNYRSFYFFVVSLSLLAIFILSFSIVHVTMLAKEHGAFLEALRDTPTSAVVILICFFGMFTVIGLAGFHTYLIAVEQTTNEDIKGVFGRPNSKNPYSRGSTCRNCCYILCGPFSTSLIDPRGHATQEFFESIQKPRVTVQPAGGALGDGSVQLQQPGRATGSNLAGTYGLPQYQCAPNNTTPNFDIAHLSTNEDLQSSFPPSRQLMPQARPNGVLTQDQIKAKTFPEIVSKSSDLETDEFSSNGGMSRNQLNGNHLHSKVVSSGQEETSASNQSGIESMSMVSLQPTKSRQRLQEDGKTLRSSPSTASLERLTMINSPLHLDPVTLL